MKTHKSGINSVLISVIMPVYNSEKTVQLSICSVLMQDYSYWELIIVDDGSSDSSGILCDQFMETDNRIKVYHIQNSGVSAARNYGLDRSKGEFICFLDSDDFMHYNALSDIIKNMEDNDLLIFGYNILPSNIKQGFSEIKKYTSIEHFANEYSNIYKYHLMNCVWNKCFRKRIINQYNCTFPIGISMGEDLLFVLSYIKQCVSIKVIGDILYDYTSDSFGSLSKRYHLDSFEVQKLLKDTTDEVLYQRRNVTEITSYIFINHIIMEIKKIVWCDELEYHKKINILFQWIRNPYFQSNYYKIKTKLNLDSGLKFWISSSSIYGLFIYLKFLQFGVSIKQLVRQSCFNNFFN